MLNGILSIALAALALAAYWFLRTDYYFINSPNQLKGNGRIIGIYRNEKKNTVQYKIQFEGEDGFRHTSNSLEYRDDNLYQDGDEVKLRYMVINCFGRQIIPIRIDNHSLIKAENYSIFTFLGGLLLIFGALNIFLHFAA